MRKYAFHLCIGTLTALLAISCFNWLINPYGIWNMPNIQGLKTAAYKPERYERIFKTVKLARDDADTIILGTSRSDLGLDPNHPALGQNAINLAIPGQPYRESRMLFDFLAEHQKMKTTVIGLDFFAANSYLPVPEDFVIENFSNERRWRLILSASTLSDSIMVISKKAAPSGAGEYSAKGQKLRSAEQVLAEGGYRKVTSLWERSFLTQAYLPQPECSFNFAASNNWLAPLEEIRSILAHAHRDHITLKLLISPSHARQWETLAAVDLWSKWEEWKRRLVKMNEEEARRAGQLPFQLWDFSGYNSITTETVPTVGDTKSMMHWYFDSSHYTPAAGDLVLDRIFNYQSPKRTVPDDFGMLLNSNNIDVHLANVRAERVLYRRTHSEDVAEIEAMARESAKTRHCRATAK
jgi:hypothetical protein